MPQNEKCDVIKSVHAGFAWEDQKDTHRVEWRSNGPQLAELSFWDDGVHVGSVYFLDASISDVLTMGSAPLDSETLFRIATEGL